MQVVVNSGFLSEVCPGEYLTFLCETFKRITSNQPGHHFVFLCEKEQADLFQFGKNTNVQVIKTPTAGPLLWKYWYDVRIPAILRKHRADVFVTSPGFCSLTTNVKQYMMVEDLAIFHHPSFFSRTQRLFYKRFTPKFINKAKRVIVLSEFLKRDIASRFEIPENKIDIVYAGVSNSYKPANEEIKREIKEKYTEGKDFFLFSGAIHPSNNLINLLKAFSFFKKRQQSGLKLMICGKEGTAYRSFVQSLRTYKYRGDVVLLENMKEADRVMVTASAYALVYPVYYDGLSMPVMEAMISKVPVITSSNSAMQELSGGAALYADPGNYNAIADQLIRLYKDENLRSELIKKGETVVHQYHWERTASLLWDSISKNSIIKSL